MPAASALREPRDLAGTRLAAHPNDAALRLFGEFCARTGLDGSGVQVEISAAPHSEMVPDLLRGREVQQRAFDAGVLVRFVGDTIAIAPPLIISTEQIHHIAATLRRILGEVE